MNEPILIKPDDTSVMIRRSFDADIQTLWRALTDPKAWLQWFGGGHAEPRHAEADLRPGGKWAIEMIGRESGESHNVRGEFVEIDAPNRISFTWAWFSAPEAVSLVTYALSPGENGRTTLTLTHERFAKTEARDNHGRGWMASFDRLHEFLAAKVESK